MTQCPAALHYKPEDRQNHPIKLKRKEKEREKKLERESDMHLVVEHLKKKKTKTSQKILSGDGLWDMTHSTLKNYSMCRTHPHPSNPSLSLKPKTIFCDNMMDNTAS